MASGFGRPAFAGSPRCIQSRSAPTDQVRRNRKGGRQIALRDKKSLPRGPESSRHPANPGVSFRPDWPRQGRERHGADGRKCPRRRSGSFAPITCTRSRPCRPAMSGPTPGQRQRARAASHQPFAIYSSTFFASTSSGTLPPSTTTLSKSLRSYFAPSAACARPRWRTISLCPTLYPHACPTQLQ